jgi:mannose-6-phosphate isomerase-like protein (cupin superfamily)
VDDFATARAATEADATAPDGCEVRLLASRPGASVAEFRLAPGDTSIAVHHRTVDEIWYVVSGHGEMWRRAGERAEVVAIGPGECVTIPVGTHFQVRCTGPDPLRAVGVTMPPWPGDDEAVRSPGAWIATVAPGPGLGTPDGSPGTPD